MYPALGALRRSFQVRNREAIRNYTFAAFVGSFMLGKEIFQLISYPTVNA